MGIYTMPTNQKETWRATLTSDYVDCKNMKKKKKRGSLTKW